MEIRLRDPPAKMSPLGFQQIQHRVVKITCSGNKIFLKGVVVCKKHGKRTDIYFMGLNCDILLCTRKCIESYDTKKKY